MDLIGMVTSQLGVSAPAAEGAVGSVLAAIKQHAPADAFAAVEQKAPEVQKWVAAAPAPDGEGGGGGLGGGLGGLVGGLAGGALGGAAGQLASLTGSLSKLGIGAGSLGQLVPMVLEFIKARAGDGIASKLMGAVPFLSQLGGGGGGGKGGGGGSPLGGLGGLFK